MTYFSVTSKTPIFYINLYENQNRNSHILSLFDRVGFENYERINAFDTQNFEKVIKFKDFLGSGTFERLNEITETKKKEFHEELSTGGVGCALSHYYICNKIVENNIDLSIVCEDDFHTDLESSKFWNLMSKLNIPKDTDMFIIDGTFYGLEKVENMENTNTISRFNGTYFYIITLQGAKKLLKHLLPIVYHVDSQLSILNLNLLNIYVYDGPKIIYHSYPKLGTNIHVNVSCPSCKKKNLNYENLEVLSDDVINDKLEKLEKIYQEQLTFDSLEHFNSYKIKKCHSKCSKISKYLFYIGFIIFVIVIIYRCICS
jgi:GR25 family glycosyltransferase involved in LPS biosynthesis